MPGLNAELTPAGGQRSQLQRAYEQALISNLTKLFPQLSATSLHQLAVPSGFYYGFYTAPGRFNPSSFSQIDSRVGRASNGLLQLTSTPYHQLYFEILSSVSWSSPDAPGAAGGSSTQETTANSEARLRAACANAQMPSRDNGGMQLSTTTGNNEPSWAVAYGFEPAFDNFDQLARNLAESSQTLTLDLAIDALDTAAPTLQGRGLTKQALPAVSSCSPVARLRQHLSSFTVAATFPGVTLIEVSPKPLSADNRTGWYASDIVRDVSSGVPTSGYRLESNQFDPQQLLNATVRQWFISRMPTIVMTIQSSSSLAAPRSGSSAGSSLAASLMSWGTDELAEVANWTGLADERFDFSRYRLEHPNRKAAPQPTAAGIAPSAGGEVTLVFAPPDVDPNQPLGSRTAWVLACTMGP